METFEEVARQRDALREALAEVQWSGYARIGSAPCPECGNEEEAGVHAGDCAVGLALVGAPARRGSGPVVVVCVRDPDASNDFTVFGGVEVEVVDVDLGRSDLSNDEEFAEWRESHETTAARLREEGCADAAEALESMIAETADRFGHRAVSA